MIEQGMHQKTGGRWLDTPSKSPVAGCYATGTDAGSVLLVVVDVVAGDLTSSSRTSSLWPSCSGLPRLTHDLQGPTKGPEGSLLGFEMTRPFLMPSSQFFGPCSFSSSSRSSSFSFTREAAAGDLSRGTPPGGSSDAAKSAESGSTRSMSRLSAVAALCSAGSLSASATGAAASAASAAV